MKHYEVNFDGLVGPSHNYAGLSFGNVASLNNAQGVSNPKQAALQGLAKMKALHDMGFSQGVLAPQQRPDLNLLRQVGFSGNDQQVLEKASKQAPAILLAAYSASSMWTANAATVSPSADTTDGKVHFTPANLTSKLHRAIEPKTTGNILQAVFKDEKFFAHHHALPSNDFFGDEGAANHTRLCADYGSAGVELFVYGKQASNLNTPAPLKFPARQTLEASQAVARLHGLDDSTTVFAQQNPDVIDQGVFHNDVIAVGNRNVLFYHQQAFLDSDKLKQDLHQRLEGLDLHFLEVPTSEVSIQDAVESYLFNTQILSRPNGEMMIVAPLECQNNPRVYAYLDSIAQRGTPITKVQYFDVKQSMQNGGGPACLRLRVALSEQELHAVNQNCLMSDSLYEKLVAWVNKNYRDQLAFDDMRDIVLIQEIQQGLDELSQILHIGSVYPFQQI
ncbi:N-succinylarginine dihydrolase [Alginatibacterium sediminis]|uniref:N-succinylarginine dihydrolase n=1 Tax=Alginatibacterium sediminis TaxID=2164068 RepID=A0A420EHT5_9ALTE|nr:N-succinylarginine dihydrolase [Alginatibacterium sediminis]RKF20259.1 N-succinylarginine dihydrolase [Alginatibacterium sediminis]